MRLRIPFVYSATVIPRKARNARDERFGEWIEVEVREATDAEAPVALRWKDTEFRPNGVDGKVERRWFGGSFWEPAMYFYSGRPNTHITAETMREWAEEGRESSPVVCGINWHVRDFINGETQGPLNPDDWRVVVASEREQCLQRQLQVADNLLVVDGLVWRRSCEPVYNISASGGFHRYIRLEIQDAPEEVRQHDGIFRIDRFDDVKSYALEKWNEEIDDSVRVDVLIPEALSYEDEIPALLAGLKQAVEGQRRDIGGRPRDEIIAWVDFRDAVAEMEANPEEHVIEAAISAAEHWVSLAEASDFHRKTVTSALRRWNARPIAIPVVGGYSPA